MISFQDQVEQADATVEASTVEVEVLLNRYGLVVTHITCQLIEQLEGSITVDNTFTVILPGGDYHGDVHFMNGFPVPAKQDVFIGAIDLGPEGKLYGFHNGPSSLLVQDTGSKTASSSSLQGSSVAPRSIATTSGGFPIVSMPCGGPIQHARDPGTLPVLLEFRADNLTSFGTPISRPDTPQVQYTATPRARAMSWARARSALRSCIAQRAAAAGGAP